MDLILYQPEIPPNTGNIARLCAATRTRLHLVGPLGFSLEDRYLKRAGLDYWPTVDVEVWPDWSSFLSNWITGRLLFTSARQGRPVHRFRFSADDGLIFGPESTGLPPELLAASPDAVITIPICDQVRSLNISTAAGIVLYEALRQIGELDRWAL
ncbi:MAG: tRNA (cytidine(34)-2'-O)-methyltransferase [Deltaproteobacteria bacterium]|nr:tRNA (cytidine(34)-2'-O)-methyltransferase [Deltaproteobacteria bacterium]